MQCELSRAALFHVYVVLGLKCYETFEMLHDIVGEICSNFYLIFVDNFNAAEYFGRQLTGDIFTLTVSRDDFWQSAFMFYKRSAELNRPFRVSFGENGIELGMDTGGPSREFFQLLAHNMTSTYFGFFEGDIPNLLPAMKGPALRLGHFQIIGTMIAHSIVNGGIGNECIFCFLNAHTRKNHYNNFPV